MNIFLFPLRYLLLKDESGVPLFLRDWLGVVVLAVVLSVPFWFGGANYFSDGGFLDRFGSFTGVLTGFYVAALVGVASFVHVGSALDDPISVGPIRESKRGEPEDTDLTRRQYVCSMFGYLAFVALALSLSAIILVVASEVARPLLAQWVGDVAANIVGYVVLFSVNLVLAHMVATTCHGLYYLIDRLYAVAPVLLDKDGNPVEPTEPRS